MHLKLIWSLAKNDFKSKYAGSQLGVFWAFFRPLVMAGVYIFVFSVIARATPVDETYPYALWLLPGLIVWFVFSESTTTGTTALTEYSYLVKKVRFDIKILPVVKVASAFIVHTIFVILVFLIYMIWGMPLRIQMIQLLYYYGATFCISLAVARITCSLHPFFKDMAAVIEILLMVFMWATPVMWDLSMLPIENPVVFKINPLYHVVQGYRESFMGGKWFWEEPLPLISFWVFTILLHALGKFLFRKFSPHFADML